MSAKEAANVTAFIDAALHQLNMAKRLTAAGHSQGWSAMAAALSSLGMAMQRSVQLGSPIDFRDVSGLVLKAAKEMEARIRSSDAYVMASHEESNMNGLRNAVVKLAHENPELRAHLVPVLRRTAAAKEYQVQDGIGKSKYTVSYHDGKKTHKDGSPFFDIKIFKNVKERDKFVKELKGKGYKEERGKTACGCGDDEGHEHEMVPMAAGDEVEAGREHGERGKGYGMSGPDVRGPGAWQPEAKGKCYYETGDEADRCYVTNKGGPGGQKKKGPPRKPGDWKGYEKDRWK